MEGNSRDKQSSLEPPIKQAKISRADNEAQVTERAAVLGVQASPFMSDVTLQAALVGNQTNNEATDQLKNLPSLHGQHTEQNKIHQPSLQHLPQNQDYFQMKLPGMTWDQSLLQEACVQYPTYQRFANTAGMEDPITDQLPMITSHTLEKPPPHKIQKTGHLVTPEICFQRERQQQQQQHQHQQQSQSTWQTRSMSCPPSIVNPQSWQAQMSQQHHHQQQQLIYQLRHPPQANQLHMTQCTPATHSGQQFTFSQPQGNGTQSIGRAQSTSETGVIPAVSTGLQLPAALFCMETRHQPISTMTNPGVVMQNLTTEIQQQQQFAMTGYQSFQPQPHEYQMQHGVTMSSESVQTNPFPRMWQTFQPLCQQSNVSRQQQHACLGVPHLIQVQQQEQQSQQDTGAEVMMRQPSGTEILENYGSPPQLNIKLPKTKDLPNTSKPWSDAELPIDILLVTAAESETLSCLFYLDNPFKSYYKDIGYVYFGYMGNGDQKKLKVALITCAKGSAVPSGSLLAVKNAIRILRTKAVFSVGTCIGLDSEKVKLGDVIVSSKLTTHAYKTPVSRDIGNLITNVADGWLAPLENPDEWEVKVHCDGDILSHPEAASLGWWHEQIAQKYPEAIAVDTEGEGVFAAAHDDKVEWVIVKGVARYGDCSQSSNDEWESFASTMAASVVENILSDSIIFQGWPHYSPDASVKSFDVEMSRSKLARHYKKTAKIPTSVWASVGQVQLDKLYTRLSWVKMEETPTGPSEEKLRHYTDLFTAGNGGNVPKRVLVQGETGIGKSTFVKKLAVDWAELDDAEMTEEQKDALRKFKLVVVVALKDVSSCQTLGEVIRRSHLFPEDEETLTNDLLSYIRDNQEKVLLVFDGYDEYRTGTEAETHFGCRSDSPICKIFQGNNLRDCTVLVTCRISQAGKLQKYADKHAEVTGFDGEDKVAFMRKMLNSESLENDLLTFLRKNKMVDLARVPLLNLFFCMLWKEAKNKMVGLTKTKAKLYQAIVCHILQYRHQKDSPPPVCKVKEEKYEELLAEIGKVALEGLLKGNQVFEYGQLSEKVRGEESLIVGLFQLSEHGACLEPTEVVSFIHKSIQEYLAAWYITYTCVPEGNLGGVEEHARSSKGFEELENVFQFVCGLSEQGAVKIFNHLATIRISDPSVDLSDFIPDEENGTNWSRDTITRRQEGFNNLVLNLFQECSSKAEVVRHLLHCTGGVVLLNYNDPSVMPSLLKVLSQGARSWTCLFNPFSRRRRNFVYDLVKVLDSLYVPVNFTESLVEIKLREFLTNFKHDKCHGCDFCFMLCCCDGRIQFYITNLELRCDAYVRVLTEAATSVFYPFLSAKLSLGQPCLKFLSSLKIIGPNGNSLKDVGALIGNCTHLKWIHIYLYDKSNHSESPDYVCDLLGQVKNPAFCTLEIGCSDFVSCAPWALTSAGAVKLAGLLPRFNNIPQLFLDVSECCATAMTTLVLSMTHKTLEGLGLEGIRLSPAATASLGQVLPEMSSLERLMLTGADGRILKAEEMKCLFGGLNKPLPLTYLHFSGFSVRGSLFPLTESFRFFPELSDLFLENLDLDERDLCDLLKSFTFLPKLGSLSLDGNPLGHAVTSIVPHLTNLPRLRYLYLAKTDCRNEDKSYVVKAVERVRPMLEVSF